MLPCISLEFKSNFWPVSPIFRLEANQGRDHLSILCLSLYGIKPNFENLELPARQILDSSQLYLVYSTDLNYLAANLICSGPRLGINSQNLNPISYSDGNFTSTGRSWSMARASTYYHIIDQCQKQTQMKIFVYNFSVNGAMGTEPYPSLFCALSPLPAGQSFIPSLSGIAG